MALKSCPKCGATRILRKVQTRTGGHPDILHLIIETWPGAGPTKHHVHPVLSADVCMRCGFTEFYVQNPELLRDAAPEVELADDDGSRPT
jgi:predicted nucleic-acid-binding Zn-ribbon protein